METPLRRRFLRTAPNRANAKSGVKKGESSGPLRTTISWANTCSLGRKMSWPVSYVAAQTKKVPRQPRPTPGARAGNGEASLSRRTFTAGKSVSRPRETRGSVLAPWLVCFGFALPSLAPECRWFFLPGPCCWERAVSCILPASRLAYGAEGRRVRCFRNGGCDTSLLVALIPGHGKLPLAPTRSKTPLQRKAHTHKITQHTHPIYNLC